jgi:predicted regulator of Ras-like GTPase activity (Roadblock/LC7/MglB family)
MLDLFGEASTLVTLLEDTRGVVGAVLGTTTGELRGVVGNAVDSDAIAANAAAVLEELGRAGAQLGLGELGVTSLRAITTTRVFARQAGAVLAIELDPRRQVAELETRLLTLAWAPEDIAEPAIGRAPTVSLDDRPTGPTEPPPLPPPPARLPPPRPPVAPGPAPYQSVPTQVKSIGSGPAFAGDLQEFSLPDLLEFLRNSHRTGLLVCTTGAGVGTIQLSRGMIIGADSPSALDLREHLLSSPDLGPERRRVLALLPPECFGDDVVDGVLGSRDLVPRDELERARIARIYSAFREMMSWTIGRFSFDPGVAVATNPGLALSAQSILMDLYQEQDEQGR